jgi:hypothetical protein
MAVSLAVDSPVEIVPVRLPNTAYACSLADSGVGLYSLSLSFTSSSSNFIGIYGIAKEG